jgi:predicted acyltransferase
MSPSSATRFESRASAAQAPGTAPQRLVSLDAFRGLTMALMVLVNNAGSGRDSYMQLRHSEWHGWTLTDTVFPTFLWIVGIAITLSMGRRLAQGVPRSKLLVQASRRAAILFVLGLAVYAFPNFNLGTQRILGVLQRIAICFLVASAIFLYTKVRGQICWLAGLLVVYWLLMTLVPVPGYGPGRLDVEGNFAHYVDHLVLGHHNYAPTKDWDPEGLVSTLPAIATTLFGLLAGRLLMLGRSLTERTKRLFLVGCVLLAAGLICNHWMPINKKLWTDSFCLFMAGLDFAVYAVFVRLVDGFGWRKPVRPMVILGMNAITIYMVSEFAAEILDSVRWQSAAGTVSLQRYLYHTLFVPLASPANSSLLYSLAFTGAMYLVAYLMYRRGWFLRV